MRVEMKRLKDELYVKVVVLFLLCFFIFFLLSYTLMHSFLLHLDLIENEKVLEEFYFVWGEIALFGTLLCASFFYIYRKIMQKLFMEQKAFKEFLYELSANKNYGVHYKAKYYKEYLEMGLLLKNIVKRLHRKGKKTLKK